MQCVPDLASVTELLGRLMKQAVTFKRQKKHETAFHELKNRLSNGITLATFRMQGQD